MFDRFPEPVADPLHAVMAAFRTDPRPQKIDLGVGVYRDETGHSPIMKAVKAAEEALLGAEDTKAYQAIHGDDLFLEGMTRLILGSDHPAVREGRVAAIQGTGGTGALRIALEIARTANPEATFHLGLPSWPNHSALAAAAQVRQHSHRYFEVERQALDMDSIFAALETVVAGDLFLLHGPCHNPTGVDFSDSQRQEILKLLRARGAIPIVDAAYYGLGSGLAADLEVLREAVAASERAFLAVACSKTFGLYRERTGILFVICASSAERDRVQGEVERTSRTLVSMPPAHGAGTVARILSDPELKAQWADELAAMRRRIVGLREELASHAEAAPMLRGIETQHGIFRMLPLTAEQTVAMGRDHAVHMPQSGRINIAGLKSGDAERLAAALAAVTASPLT